MPRISLTPAAFAESAPASGSQSIGFEYRISLVEKSVGAGIASRSRLRKTASERGMCAADVTTSTSRMPRSSSSSFEKSAFS
jgi:hypothetical protein